MKFKTALTGALLVLFVAPTSSAQAYSTADFLSQLQVLEERLSVLQAKLDLENQTSAVDTDNTSLLSVSIAGEVVNAIPSATEAEAMKNCEAIAFDPQHMWQEVRCEYAGTTLYQDTFVAG